MIWDIFLRYNGSGIYFILYFLAIMFVFFIDKEKRNFFVYPALLILFLIINPLFYQLITTYIFADNVYYRILWLLPLPIVIAYVFTYIISQQKDNLYRGVIFIIVSILIILSGEFIYKFDDEHMNFEVAENYYKLPNATIGVSQLIHEDAADGGSLKLAAPYLLATTIRQYDASIPLLYGRVAEYYNYTDANTVAAQLNSDIPDLNVVIKIAQDYDCRYFALYTWQTPEINPTELGAELVGTVEYYRVYKVPLVDSTE